MSTESNKNYPKITVRQRPGTEDSMMVGANTEVLLNGKKLPYTKSLQFAVNAKGVATVKLEMYANVEVEGIIGDLETVVIPLVPKKGE